MAVGEFALPASAMGGGGGGGTYTRVLREYTASGVWTKPAGLTHIEVYCVGGGGAGASGSNFPSGVVSRAGSGGAAGGVTYNSVSAAAIGATVSFTVGAGSTGGAAVSATSTVGNNGGTGGNTAFGAFGNALGGNGGTSTTGGVGGTSSSIYTDIASYFRTSGVNASATGGSSGASTTETNNTFAWNTISGAPAGGGLQTNNSFNYGASGGRMFNRSGTLSTAAQTGGNAGDSGQAGVNNWNNRICASATSIALGQTVFVGTTGSGGNGSTTTNGGAGGNGGLYGGPGAGGGGTRTGYSSGKGGDGAQGFIIVIEHITT